MLYDKRWDAKVETKPDPFSLESLIAWLEKQPANTEYDFFDYAGRCLICQYLTAHQVDWWNGYGRFAVCVGDGIAFQQPWTFGAALKRARKELARRPF